MVDTKTLKRVSRAAKHSGMVSYFHEVHISNSDMFAYVVVGMSFTRAVIKPESNYYCYLLLLLVHYVVSHSVCIKKETCYFIIMLDLEL